MNEVEVGKLAYESCNTTQSYEWVIEKFQPLSESNAYLLSPLFSTLHSNNAKHWRILFRPRNSAKELQNYSSVFLQYFGENEVVVSVEFYIKLYGNSYRRQTLQTQLFSPQNALHGFNSFINIRDSELNVDTLRIGCEISFDQEVLAIPISVHVDSTKEVKLNGNSSEGDFQGDLDKLFESGMLSDVTITVGQERIPLHKAILASRSEVFRAMFQHDMVEKEQNVVNIVDINKDIAVELFRYMYTGKFNNIENLSLHELLIAAEKYDVTGLKVVCENTLCNDLNFDNALQYLTLADLHNSIGLKKKVTDFIIKNLNKFVDKPEFKSLDQSILCELFSAVAIKNIY